MTTVALVHERPADPRLPATRICGARARRGRRQHDPDDDRRRHRRRSRAAQAQGQARRHRHPRADRETCRWWTSFAELDKPATAAGGERRVSARPSTGSLRGILDATDEGARSPPTSTATRTARSSTCRPRPSSTANLIKVLAWYDNEWGYSSRVARPHQVHRQDPLIVPKLTIEPPAAGGANACSSAPTSTSPLEGGAGDGRHAPAGGGFPRCRFRASTAAPAVVLASHLGPAQGRTRIRSTR